MEIQLSNEQSIAPIGTETVKSKIRAILSDLGYPEAELSLVLTDDEGIARLNERYLGRPGPTNVISFPQQEGEFVGVNPNLLGDVVISVETAVREAETAGMPLEWALSRLMIHGILHLVGYDHEAPDADAEAMEAKSRELMVKIEGRA